MCNAAFAQQRFPVALLALTLAQPHGQRPSPCSLATTHIEAPNTPCAAMTPTWTTAPLSLRLANSRAPCPSPSESSMCSAGSWTSGACPLAVCASRLLCWHGRSGQCIAWVP
eukprot:365252-Chlamydomonas_euryale.AAC.10